MNKSEFEHKWLHSMERLFIGDAFEKDLNEMVKTECAEAVQKAINSISFNIDQLDSTVSQKPTRKDYESI